MWAFLAGLAALASAVLLRLLDLVVEGRGSWVRRSIKADVELLAELPPDIRDGLAGQALVKRIESALTSFGSSDGSDTERDFEREVDRLEARVTLIGFLLLALATGASWVLGEIDIDDTAAGSLVIVFLTTLVLSLPLLFAARRLAVVLVRRSWKRRGKPLPVAKND